jgi:hypothetical protein
VPAGEIGDENLRRQPAVRYVPPRNGYIAILVLHKQQIKKTYRIFCSLLLIKYCFKNVDTKNMY